MYYQLYDFILLYIFKHYNYAGLYSCTRYTAKKYMKNTRDYMRVFIVVSRVCSEHV